MHARFATWMNGIFVHWSEEEITMIFVRQNPNFDNEGGKKEPCEVLSSWETIGKIWATGFF